MGGISFEQEFDRKLYMGDSIGQERTVAILNRTFRFLSENVGKIFNWVIQVGFRKKNSLLDFVPANE